MRNYFINFYKLKNMKFFMLNFLMMFYLMVSNAQSADDIINQYIEATGGKALWGKVQSIKHAGHYVMGPGALAPVTNFQSKENSYSEFTWNGMTSKSARKNNEGWGYNPFGGKRIADPMTKDQIRTDKLMSDVQGLFFDYASKGYNAEYLGTDDFDGTDVHKIRLTTKEGDMIYYYFDKESHYLLKVYMRIKLSDKEQKITTNFSDFKKTKFGIILPFASNWVTDEGEEGGLTQLTEVEVNTPVDAAKLEMPK